MKIIGHRGDRGTELENSLASIRKALALDLDGIEFDIHRTKDDVLVVMHDATTKRTGQQDVRIADVTFSELQKTRLKNGQEIPTLDDVLRLVTHQVIYIDIKDPGTSPLLAKLLQGYPGLDVCVASRLASELLAFRALRADIPTYMYFLLVENPILRPVHMVLAGKRAHVTGLGLNKVIINPVTYWLARKHGLKMYSYSVGSLWLAKLFRMVYPGIDLMTSRPERINRQTLHR